ncbi:5'-methylthioadenosine/S-adenosylhomocysteine nucleosidase family protein [Hyunsoonleella rubra]|uniref:Nucleoside phosphorylase domain-containing protein n=1 Tax=Hyunsoonleella rubra TaxID=1737062 RepID=A0ABW5TCE1_9FLAO
METKNINLVVFDEEENFNKTKELLGYEGATIKRFYCVQSLIQMKEVINQLDDDDIIFLVIHVFGTTKNLKGIVKFKNSGILDEYPKLSYMYISEGNKQDDIQKLMIDNRISVEQVFKYHEVLDEIRNRRKIPLTKKELLGTSNILNYNTSELNNYKDDFKFDYAIITALEEDEMEKILPIIEREGKIDNSKHLVEFGHIKGYKSKKVIYASQQATGMIDAAILSTELLQYRPKYLIMAGVLGGKPKKTNIGDVVIATKTFTIDKGKIDDLGFHPEIESSSNENACITSIRREKQEITNFLRAEDKTRNSKIKIHFGPIGCVRQVIDLEDYFKDSISTTDRKAIALEMESYAVSRSCELVNNGQTKALIIKSVMDNTQDKDDDGKSYASWSSAMFVKYILKNDII